MKDKVTFNDLNTFLKIVIVSSCIVVSVYVIAFVIGFIVGVSHG